MKTSAIITAITKSIVKMDRILVYRHTNPDPDAIGAQFGLVALLKAAYPEKLVVAMAPVPGHLAWIDTTDEQLVTPQATDLVIAVDCANHERLAGELPTGAFVIKIDHHPNHDPYGQLNWVDETYSSCSEMIYELAQAGRFTVTAAVATKLYAGVIGDTVRFSTPETSTRTLKIASALAATDIDIATISHHEMDLTPALSKLYGYVLSEQTIEPSGLAHVVLPQRLFSDLSLEYGDEDALVPLPGNLTTVKVWLFFIETPQGQYRVHFRSKAINVNAVAKAFNGGGHPLASGAFVPDLATVGQVIEQMQAQILAATAVDWV